MQSNYHQECFLTSPLLFPRFSLFILRAGTRQKLTVTAPPCSQEAFKGSCCSLVFAGFRAGARNTGGKKRERVPKERPSNKLMGPGSFLSWAPVLCYLLGYWLQSPWIQLRFSCFEFLSEIKSMRFITQCSPSSSDLLPMIQVPLTNYTPGKNLFGLFFFSLHISTYSASSGRWRKRPHEALCKLYLSTVH